MEDNLGFKRREVEFPCRNPMVNRAVDVLGGVLEGDSKTIEAMALDLASISSSLSRRATATISAGVVGWVSPSVESVSAIDSES